jgi:hypothetical protein
MKESYEEGLANRLGPESYADDGNIVGVATTGVRAGQPSSSENTFCPAGRPCSAMGKATPNVAFKASHICAAAESETLCMHGNSKRENRETPKTPSAVLRPRTGGAGVKPYVPHARFRGVGRFGSTCEADEQDRPEGGGGVRGRKGIGQGERSTNLTRAGRSAGSIVASDCAACARRQRFDAFTRGRSRMR